MKQVIFGMVSILMITLFFLIMMTIYGRNMRQEETVRGLTEAMDVAITELMENQENIENDEMFSTLLLQKLLVQMNSTSDVQVKILDADAKLGILSVEVIEKYKHPNGQEGTVSQVRTILFDKKVEKEEKEYETVSFYSEENVLYKEYRVEKGAVCQLPVAPMLEGKVFKHWRFFESEATGQAYSMNVTGALGNKSILALSETEAYAVNEDTKLLAVYE